MEKFSLERIKELKIKEKPEIISMIESAGERSKEIIKPELPAGEINIIAEIKQASPTKGVIKKLPSIKEQAEIYNKSGAKAISVLTEKNYFGGKWENIKIVSSEVNLPVLCKEFIYYKEQIDLAYLYGADLVLLIAMALTDDELKELYNYIVEKGMTPLIEANSVEELPEVLSLNPELLMVNMRNLSTLNIDIDNGIKTLKEIPASISRISASGITSKEKLEAIYKQADANNFLIGTSIMESENPSEFIKELTNVC